MSMVSKTSCSHFTSQGSYYGYTHAWTKLHNEVMSWMSVIMHGSYLRQTPLLCMIWRYCLWAAWHCLSWSAVAFSRYIGMELLEIHRINFRFSTSANLKCTYPLNFGIWLHANRHTCTHASCNAVPLVWGSLRLAPTNKRSVLWYHAVMIMNFQLNTWLLLL